MTKMADAPTTWLGAPPSGSTRNCDDVLLVLEAAVAWAKNAARLKDTNSMGVADGRLRDAVEAARAAGVAWGTIGNALGMARGNAYQKYRKRPC